jgi:amino acid adenylation domain-containing protein
VPETAFEQISAICLDELSELDESGQAVDVGGAETDLAYCIYTSGSTGRPKGVLIEHRNVIRLILNDRTPFAFGSNDVWTMFHSYAFDFSVWEVFGALLTGGRVVVVPGEVTKDPKLFLDLLERDGVTVLNQTPAAFYSLSREVLRERRALRLRYVIFGGEALQSVQLREWNDAYPSVEMINMYGITETTVHVTFKRLGRADIEANSASIGRPIPTTTTYIMDSRQRLLPRGVPGEICVGGLGVGRGYLNRDELTSEKFILNPYQASERLYRSGDLARLTHDGEMIYLGRADDQVQIRGFRVETGEIQERLLAHPQVAEAIIMARSEDGRSTELTAYVLPKRGSISGTTSTSNGAEAGKTRRYHLPNGMEIFHLNKNETDFLYQEIFEESSYLKHDVTLEDGDCVFDVGANIGLFTLFAGQSCRDARIFSFEPIPATFDVLQRNAELYSLNAKVFQCGIGRDNREEVFTSYPHISIFSGRFAVPEEEQKIIKSFVMHQQHEGPVQSVLESARSTRFSPSAWGRNRWCAS